jgi:hypothetical protein
MIIEVKHISGDLLHIEVEDTHNTHNNIKQKIATILEIPSSLITVFCYNENEKYGYLIDSTTIELTVSPLITFEDDDHEKKYPLRNCYLEMVNSSGEDVFTYFFIYHYHTNRFIPSDQIMVEEFFDRDCGNFYTTLNLIGKGVDQIEEMIETDNTIPVFFKTEMVRVLSEKWNELDEKIRIHP